MQFSLSQAAKETGKGKSSIHRAIKAGRLSAQRHEDGTYSIDAAELFRAFPPALPEPAPERSTEPHQEQPATPTVAEEVLRVRVEMLTAQLEREQDTVADLRRRLDRAEERILALSHSPATAPASPLKAPDPQPGPKPPRRGLWSFLRRS
jgi:hypothetical protein